MNKANLFPAAVAASLVATAGVMPAPAQGQQSQQSMSGQQAQQVIQNWPESSKKAASAMLEKYGEPDAVTDSRLIWRDNRPWVRTIVYKEEIQHNFPVPHKDVMEQFINYEVPAEKFSDLARYDGSVVAYRTNGELSARCDKEGANILALNLANDIIEGQRSVEEARAFYAQTMQKVMQGEEPEYVRSLQFEPMTASAAADPDEKFSPERSAQAASSPSSQQGAQASSQQSGQSIEAMTTAQLIDKEVVSAEGESVGTITDVSTDEQGEKVAHIEAGGVLGIGATSITLPISDLSTTAEGKIKTSMTQSQIEAKQKQQEQKQQQQQQQ